MILERLRSGASFRASHAPWDDFWYSPPGRSSGIEGIRVSPETALTLSAFWAGLTKKAKDFASLPCLLYRRKDPTGRERAIDRPLYRVLRYRPNPWQTAFDYQEMLSAHVDLRGNFYAQILDDPNTGEILALIPRHPDRMTPELLPSGRRRYIWRPPGKPEVILTQDQVHHVSGPSLDGVKGMSAIEYGARSIGIAMATDVFNGQFFNQGGTPPFVVSHPLTLGETGLKNLRDSISAWYGGLKNAFNPLVLEEAMTAVPLGIKPQEMQLVELKGAGVEDMARWLDMPLHKLKVAKPGAVSYASVEMAELDYVMNTQRPLCIRVEQCQYRDFLSDVEQDTYYSEHLIEALLRGDSQTRALFYKSGIDAHWLLPNEARERENLDPLPGGDDFPQMQAPNPSGPPGTTPRDPTGKPRGSYAETRARLITFEAAARMVRKEIGEATKAAQHHASDPAAWQGWLTTFYEAHAGYLGQVLSLPAHQARAYTTARRLELSSKGVPAMTDWETRVVPQLAALALGDDEAA